MSLPDDYDPPEHSRAMFRHHQTGELGWAVRRGGKAYIRLDRPQQEILRVHNGDWIEEDATRPLTPIAIARVCFEADKGLCVALGLMDKARAEWNNLTDRQRIAWIEAGPKSPAVRAMFYARNKEFLGEFGGRR